MDSTYAATEVERANEIGRIAAGDIAHRAGNRYPEKPAFVVPERDETVTFAEFDRRTNRAAHALREAGYEKGSRLAFVAGNSLQFLEAYFGALKAGVVPVFINPEITPADIAYEFDHSEADGLLVDDALHAKTAPLVADNDIETVAAFEWEGTDVPVPSFRTFTEGHDDGAVDIEIVDDLPKTTTGKVQKFELAEDWQTYYE